MRMASTRGAGVVRMGVAVVWGREGRRTELGLLGRAQAEGGVPMRIRVRIR